MFSCCLCVRNKGLNSAHGFVLLLGMIVGRKVRFTRTLRLLCKGSLMLVTGQ